MTENLLIHTYVLYSGQPADKMWCVNVLLDEWQTSAFSEYLLDKLVEEFGTTATVTTMREKRKPDFRTATQILDRLKKGDKISDICENIAELTIAISPMVRPYDAETTTEGTLEQA